LAIEKSKNRKTNIRKIKNRTIEQSKIENRKSKIENRKIEKSKNRKIEKSKNRNRLLALTQYVEFKERNISFLQLFCEGFTFSINKK
jgi:hypothetical protein